MRFRQPFLLGASALAFNAALASALVMTPEQAFACDTVASNSTISGTTSCVAWNSANLTVTNTGKITGSSLALNVASGSVGNLSNSGSIIGQRTGASNGGSIGILTNVGTILGTTNIGINNSSFIDTISNSGLIKGQIHALQNSGSINLLANNGTIKNANSSNGVVVNTGVMGTVTNSGLIDGGEGPGFYNFGSIGQFTNTSVGSINGYTYGIHNFSGGVIGTLTNDGMISSNFDGIHTDGSIALVVNGSTGSISAAFAGIGVGGGGVLTSLSNIGTIRGVQQGISLSGTIGTIENSGYISGFASGGSSLNGLGILNDGGTIAQLTNDSGGMITGALTGIYNDAISTIGTITNNGTINAPTIGINNLGAINAITNNGTISAELGIFDNGTTIGTISNSGTITGGVYGISASSDTIGTISNAVGGTIVGLVGIDNSGGIISAISNSGSIFGGNSAIFNNGGTIGTITNNGTIDSNGIGISNNDTVFALLNNSGGIIGGNSSGIANTGSIGTIGNSQLIEGATTGIHNSGTIGTITNSGSIEATLYTGIRNTGSIGAIQNSGTISGSVTGTGLWNGGNISIVTNDGTIVGHFGGINQTVGATIGTITNNLLISGGTEGIDNAGTINLVTNSGVISGGQTGIWNNGTINTINNTGLIEGPHAIFSTGTILSALSNAGTIEGAINVNQALTITGGSIGGPGTLMGYNGTIATITTNNNNLTFDVNAYQLLDDDINVGASNTVFNNGTVQVNTTHSITGKYNQGAGGTLIIGVADSTHYGQLIVSGAATMTNGQVLITSTSGSLTIGETFTIVEAATAGTSYSGVTATANGFLINTSSITIGGVEDLIVSLGTILGGGSGGPSNYQQLGQAYSGANGAAVGTALDQIQSSIANGGNSSFAPILTALNNIGAQQGVAAEGAAIKQLAPNQIAPQLAASPLLVNQGAQVIAEHQQNMLSSGSDAQAGRSAGSEYRSGLFWGQVSGGIANANDGNSGGGYGQNSYGLTAGTDFKVTNSAKLGVALAWLHANAWGTGAASGSNLLTNSFQLTGYGSKRFGPAFVDGMLGFGYNRFDQSRAIGFLGSSASASYSGLQYTTRAETGWDIPVSVRVVITPVAGFEATRMANDAYSESGAGAADLSVGRQIIDSYATTLGFRAATFVPTGWGSLQPQIKLGWVHDLTNNAVLTSGTLDGVGFATATPRLSPDGVRAGMDVDLQKSDNLTLSAGYNLEAREGFLSNDGQIKAAWKF